MTTAHKVKIPGPDPDGFWRSGFRDNAGRVTIIETDHWPDVRSRPASGVDWRRLLNFRKEWEACRLAAGAGGVLYVPECHPCRDCFTPMWIQEDTGQWTFGHGFNREAVRMWPRLDLTFHDGMSEVLDWLSDCHEFEIGGLRGGRHRAIMDLVDAAGRPLERDITDASRAG